MVRIPKEATQYKKEHPNILNEEAAGGEFAFLCVRNGKSSWGKMFRNAIIKAIRPNYKDIGLTEIDISGTSDWKKCETTCILANIV